MELTRSSMIDAPVDEVFAFCTSKSGFEKHFPYAVRWIKADEQWQTGSIVTFKLQLAKLWFFELWITYEAQLIDCEKNKFFIDVMRIGPYKYFRHRHDFEAVGDRTYYTDTVNFSLGLGRFLDYWLGLKPLENTFKKRHANMSKCFQRDRNIASDRSLNYGATSYIA